MGYYTAYGLTLVGDDDKVIAFEEDLKNISKDSNGEVDADVRNLIDDGAVYAKLYDIEDWISEAAQRHPDVLVILNGDGEDSEDMWEARWKGLEYEKQDAAIPPFTNEALLTEQEKNKRFNN